MPHWSATGSDEKALSEPNLHPLHKAVSNVIADMNVVWVEVGNDQDRIELEKQCIRLLSNHLRADAPIDKAFENWLGSYALKQEIGRSGLWNVQHVKRPHTPGLLDAFKRYFDS